MARTQMIAIFFWALVLSTTGVSARWGAMSGLMFFILALFTGLEVLARWSSI